MNYFELFDLPVSFQVDYNLLKKKYDELSRNVSDDSLTAVGTPGSANKLNTGFKLLQDQDRTIEYVLQLKGLSNHVDAPELDPQFMMEVMDINEELVELGLDENREQLMNVEQKANRLMLKIYEDVAPIIANYKEDTATEEELLQVKGYYVQKKYLQSILDKIKGIRNIATPD